MKKYIMLWLCAVLFIAGAVGCVSDKRQSGADEGYLCVVESLDSENFQHVSYITLAKERESIRSVMDSLTDASLVSAQEELLWTLLDDNVRLDVVASIQGKNKTKFEKVAFITSPLSNTADKNGASHRYNFPQDIIGYDTTYKNPRLVIDGYFFQAFPNDTNFDFNQDGIRDYFIGFYKDDEIDQSSYYIMSMIEGKLKFLDFDMLSDYEKFLSEEDKAMLRTSKYRTLDYVLNPIYDEERGDFVINLKSFIVAEENGTAHILKTGDDLGYVAMKFVYDVPSGSWEIITKEIKLNE